MAIKYILVLFCFVSLVSASDVINGGDIVWGNEIVGFPSQATKNLASSCSNSDECISGFCVDSYCCDSSCIGACRSCALPGTVGYCTFVPNFQDPDSECPGLYGPCANSVCNGAGACGFLTGKLSCGTCQECSGSSFSCTSISAGTDPFAECPKMYCGTGNCDGSNECGWVTSGETGGGGTVCPRCQTCAGATSPSCVNMAANTQDVEGTLTCGTDIALLGDDNIDYNICKKCDGTGSCINENAGEDLWGQCGTLQCGGGSGCNTGLSCNPLSVNSNYDFVGSSLTFSADIVNQSVGLDKTWLLYGTSIPNTIAAVGSASSGASTIIVDTTGFDPLTYVARQCVNDTLSNIVCSNDVNFRLYATTTTLEAPPFIGVPITNASGATNARPCFVHLSDSSKFNFLKAILCPYEVSFGGERP